MGFPMVFPMDLEARHGIFGLFSHGTGRAAGEAWSTSPRFATASSNPWRTSCPWARRHDGDPPVMANVVKLRNPWWEAIGKPIGKWWFNGGLMGFNGIYPPVI